MLKPQVIKTMFKYREDDIQQKEMDVEEAKKEYIVSQMNPNRMVAQLEKIGMFSKKKMKH